MVPVFSGEIVYEYFQEESKYGLVEVNGATAELQKDYETFSSQLAKVSLPTGTQMGAYDLTESPANCPSQDASWSAAFTLPTTPEFAAVNEAGASDQTEDSGQLGEGTSAAATATGSSTGVSSQSADSGLCERAKIGIGVGVGLGVVLLLALGAYFLWRRKRKSGKKQWPNPAVEKDRNAQDGAAIRNGQRHELEQPKTELPIGGEAQELPARHGKSDMGRSTSSPVIQGVESRHG